MRWGIFDIAIVVVFALQLLVWSLVAVFVFKLKTGPICRLWARIEPLTGASKNLVSQAMILVGRLSDQVRSLTKSGTSIRRRFVLPSPPSGMWLHPRNLQGGLAFITQLKTSQRLFLPPKPTSKRLHLAERLGLVPPLLKKLLPIRVVLRTVLNTAKQLRR